MTKYEPQFPTKRARSYSCSARDLALALAVLCMIAAGCTAHDLGTASKSSPNGTAATPHMASSDTRPVSATEPLPFSAADVEVYKEVTTWFLEFEHEPLVMGGDPAALDEDLERFRRDAHAQTLSFEQRYLFRGIVNGLTIHMASDQLPALARMDSVRKVYPVGITYLPQLEHVSEPQLATALGMTGADVVQNELGFDGSGIKIGIIDSGIDLQHPDLAPRIIGGFDFVGDAYNGTTVPPSPEPAEGSRPGGDDCGGHGTHVAGIVAASGDPAQGGARGVAPGAQLAAYRVFGCSGSTDDDVIVAAIERAYEDGMDIINLSLGSDNGWSDDFLSLALSRVRELGMVPVAAAGNNGRAGTFTLSSPAAGEHVIAVASYDNLFTRTKRAQLSTGRDIGYGTLTGAPEPPSAGESAPLAYVGQGCDADTYLSEPAGKVALITRGVCTFSEKYARAVQAGALGVVIENNAPGNFSGTLGGSRHEAWGISISQEAGSAIKAALPGAQLSLRWLGGFMAEENPTGGYASAFSSYGLTPELVLKPDIGAPGGFIRSTYPLERTDSESPGYAVLGGTSMASPYVTGAIALLLSARPDLPREQVRTVLQNTAEPKAWFGDRASPALDSVHRQGAGMVRIDRAILATTLVTPGKLSLGESQAGAFETTLYLENQSDGEVSYALGNEVRALATGPDTFVPEFFETQSKVTFSRVSEGGGLAPIDSITVPAHGARSFSVRIEAPVDLPDGSVYGGYLTLTPTAGSASSASVPYAGFKGDYQALDVVVSEPRLLARIDTELEPAAPGRVYSMQGGDRPAFSLGLGHGVERVDASIVGLDQNGWLGALPVMRIDMMRRSDPGEPATFSAGDFDATVLPDGRYRFRIDLLRALGDGDNPRHHQVVESPWFTIARSGSAPDR